MIRGTSEGSETLELVYSTRRIQFCPDFFCLGIILKVIQYNFQNNAYTKIVTADLNSPRQELSNGGLGIVVTLLVSCQSNYSCASPGKAIQLYMLLGTEINIYTDHKNLTFANFNTQRVLRWRCYVEEYAPKLFYL